MAKKTITKIRAEIDSIDKQIQLLINNRANLALDIAQLKKTTENKDSFYRPEREAQVLKAIIDRNDGKIKDKDIAHIFREIMSACLALEQSIKVAYLGPAGTFTQEAALKHFGNTVSTIHCNNIDEIFSVVENDNANYGVAPIENSSNGVVGITIDMLHSHKLKICGEVEIPIRHQLMIRDKSQQIKTIYSHQQSFDQCRQWINSNYPNAQLRSVASNSLAANMVKSKDNAAAIASKISSNLYDLEIIAKNIEDKTSNTTRFLVLGKEEVGISGKDKTSILVLAKHKSGSLFDILEPFKNNNINILQLVRHPIPGVKWEYLFLIDIEGHQKDKKVELSLKDIANKALKIEILGSYPQTIL